MSNGKGGNRNRNKGNKSKIRYNGPEVICPYCNKSISDMSTAISSPDMENKASHFDCVIASISKKEDIKLDEKVVYLGSGRFAVVKREDYARRKLNIVKNIDFEVEEEGRSEWRNNLQQIKSEK